MKGKVLVAQSCLTLCKPMDYSCQIPLFMGFSRQDYGRKPWVHSTCASDRRELLRVPLRIRDTVEFYAVGVRNAEEA